VAKHKSAAQRREQILVAALACFAQQGYAETRMDDIVRQSGLSKGALYHHFAGKQEVFMGLFERFEQEIWSGWKNTASLPALEAIEQQGNIVLEQVLGMPGLIGAWIEFLRHPESRARFANIYAESRRQLATTVRRGIRAGELRRCNAAHLAATLTALVEGLILQAMADPEFDAQRHWRGAWNLLRDGVAPMRT
jgi:AcrR family transcriptional regulator